MTICRRLVCCFLALLALILPGRSLAQSETATLSGRITDPQENAVPSAQVRIVNIDTNVASTTFTNDEGIYVLTSIKPGRYRQLVVKDGFHEIIKPEFVLNVQDHLEQNFRLQVGSVSESVTVEASGVNINTTDASVSTVVDRQFAENLPMNGRSFQTLIQLTPGVVVIPTTNNDTGQFSVNGQRGESNYLMLDGVSANASINGPGLAGNSFGGAVGSFNALGGTNSLVSVDALQEFRIQTSTYAPEFGRQPGAQISILTRSGTNQWHGTLFDYLRNDVLDANDWFANEKGQPKPKERQNDFGGTFSGPILKDRTFFFFSYEGLRLRSPQVALTDVPCDSSCTVFGNARAMADSTMQPYLNAFPLPNGPEVFTPCTPGVSGCPVSGQQAIGAAQFNKSYSNPATLDAYSLRVDHRIGEKLNIFGRYNYSPSEAATRGSSGGALSLISPSRITIQTGTLGTTWTLSPALTNDFRFNYSRTEASNRTDLDNFGGAVPLTSLGLPSPFTSQNASLSLVIGSLFSTGGALSEGTVGSNLQRQVNVVDNLSWQKGSHALKFGLDFRHLSPLVAPESYLDVSFFADVASAESHDNQEFGLISSSRAASVILKNFGAFGQDTWRIAPRLTITYGLRWDLDFAPSSNGGPNILAVTGYNLRDLSNLALAPVGTSPFRTTYGNVAPRLGLAYQISQSQEWQTVVRGGFGVFYDLVTSQAGNAFNPGYYPFGGSNFVSGGSFPSTAPPPAIVPPNATNNQILYAYDPHIKMPYTLEWNFAVEQALGKHQTISASYIGSAGRRLLQTADILNPNANLSQAQLIGNTASSDYDAIQLQFNRRLSRGLQALASYTWSHSIDNASAGSYANTSNELPATLDPKANRGASDFDIRNAFTLGITYAVPEPKTNAVGKAVLGGWSVQSIVQARSAPPVDITDNNFSQIGQFVGSATIRPDVVPGKPLYVFGSQCVATFGSPCPGGKGFNPAALTDPPVDSSTGNASRQGTLGRNTFRGFGATQWDFGVHREFPIHESLKLEFRAEMFNVLNHPNFGPPNNRFGNVNFGLSNKMLGQYLNGGNSGVSNLGSGAFSPLYQIGGPRSIQFGLKLIF